MNPSDSRYGPAAFVSLYAPVGGLPAPRDSPALGNQSSITCRPCYPGSRWMPLPLFQHPSNGLPLLSTGSTTPNVYEATHRFTCVTACSLAVWKLTTPCCHDAASSCYRGVRTTPRTGLQPARLTAVTANGQTTVSDPKHDACPQLHVFRHLLCLSGQASDEPLTVAVLRLRNPNVRIWTPPRLASIPFNDA